jgi:hypothetical protein
MFLLIGAWCFGFVVGWNLYFLNRHRQKIQISDLATLIGAVGGAAVLALFPAGTDLFAAYGIGLFLGFFGYFGWVISLVTMSRNFSSDYFIDGRRRMPDGNEVISMSDQSDKEESSEIEQEGVGQKSQKGKQTVKTPLQPVRD